MTQPDFRGKTKKDLSAIAQISGLLTPSETNRMTKQQLIDFLTRVAEESTQDEGEAAVFMPEETPKAREEEPEEEKAEAQAEEPRP